MAGKSVEISGEEAVRGNQPRFAFGKNWRRFLQHVNEERIAEAEKSLCGMLEVENLKGKSFLDIGSGSGLFSLAAMRLGADRVHSFDYDPLSVACTQELKRRWYRGADHWTIERGDALDSAYLCRLGQFDVVYSWGVLHHTGDMWRGLENAVAPVRANGKLFIALYNNQGFRSRVWKAVKRRYSSGFAWRPVIFIAFGLYFVGQGLLVDLIKLQNPLKRYREYQLSSQVGRGMSFVTNLIDWLGGYPFEVSAPGEVFDFFRKRGFVLMRLKTAGGGIACNEYVFQKETHNA